MENSDKPFWKRGLNPITMWKPSEMTAERKGKKKKKVATMLLLLLALACSKEEEGCTCTGKYQVVGQEGFFYAEGVDCDTGQPVIDNQGDILTVFKGCN